MARRWVFWLLIVGFLWVLISRFTEIEKLVKTISGGIWQLIILAAIIQVIYYVVFTGTYKMAFKTVDVPSRLWDLLPVTLGAVFVNVVAPVGGAAGAALFIDDASRRGQSATRAATGILLQLISDFCAFALILVVGLVYLFIQHDLQAYEVIGAFVLLVIILSLSSVLVLGLWHVDLLHRLLGWLQSASRWFAKQVPYVSALSDDWVEHNTREFSEAAQAIARYPNRLTFTFVTALIAHILDIITLYVLFQAFGQPISLGPLVAGYGVGILFWIVSPTPQGIGVVEGVMSLVYTSLHIPGEIALTVTLAFRGLTFWLPLFLGFVMLRKVRIFSPSERSIAEPWSVRIVAILTGIMGIINILSGITPALAQRLAVLEKYSPLELRHGSHLASTLAGFALLMVAGNLWRRKRIAWIITELALIISSASHLLKGLDYEEAFLAASLALWLLILRPHFHARSDPPSRAQGLRILLFSIAFTLLYGVTGFYLLDHHYRVNYDLWSAARQTVVMFSQFNDPGLEPITGFGRYFADSIYVIGAVSLSYALIMLVRPVLVRQLATQEERDLAQSIVNNYGRSSLARLTLLEDKAYYFSPGGSFIAYVVKGRVAVALGDPIGPDQDLLATIIGFRELCELNDWIPTFYQTLPDNLQLYQNNQFESLCIGQEGIVHLDQFSLEGREAKSLRSAHNRLTKLGYQVIFHQSPISNELLKILRSISDEWLTMVHGSEKRFSLGWFDDNYIRNGQVAAVYSEGGQIVAFANLVPEYLLKETTIDLMRHRRETEPGTMDFLFVSLFQWAQEQGYSTFNLGLSALYGIGEHPGDPAIERTLRFVYEHINQFYNFKGVHGFKHKFHPEWSPRYLVYPNVTSLPSAWVAVSSKLIRVPVYFLIS